MLLSERDFTQFAPVVLKKSTFFLPDYYHIRWFLKLQLVKEEITEPDWSGFDQMKINTQLANFVICHTLLLVLVGQVQYFETSQDCFGTFLAQELCIIDIFLPAERLLNTLSFLLLKIFLPAYRLLDTLLFLLLKSSPLFIQSSLCPRLPTENIKYAFNLNLKAIIPKSI